MTDLVALKAANANRWQNAKVTRRAEMMSVAKRLVAAKARYQDVEQQTGVPWAFIAVVHEREASQRFDTQLGQGDPLNRVSVHVPTGRGPFKSWEDGALDALVKTPPYAAANEDWSIGGLLTMCERYNGMIYASHGRPSPYVWSGTTIYDPPTGPGGKVLVDHGPIENVTDKQIGCAGLLMAMMAIDRTISIDGKFAPVVEAPVILPTTPTHIPDIPDVPRPDPVPQVQPAKSFWADLFSAFISLFKKGT